MILMLRVTVSMVLSFAVFSALGQGARHLPDSILHSLFIGVSMPGDAYYRSGENPKPKESAVGVDSDEVAVRGMLGHIKPCVPSFRGPIPPCILREDAATLANVAHWVKCTSGSAVVGDVVIIYFSGHGFQAGPKTRANWVLYDDLLDIELLSELFEHYVAGVRVILVADCCAAGEGTRYQPVDAMLLNNLAKSDFSDHKSIDLLKSEYRRFDSMPSSRKQMTFVEKPSIRRLPTINFIAFLIKKMEEGKGISAYLRPEDGSLSPAKNGTVFVYRAAACSRTQSAYCLSTGSFFTNALLARWAEGRNQEPLLDLIGNIELKKTPTEQVPELNRLGPIDSWTTTAPAFKLPCPQAFDARSISR